MNCTVVIQNNGPRWCTNINRNNTLWKLEFDMVNLSAICDRHAMCHNEDLGIQITSYLKYTCMPNENLTLYKVSSVTSVHSSKQSTWSDHTFITWVAFSLFLCKSGAHPCIQCVSSNSRPFSCQFLRPACVHADGHARNRPCI